MNLLTAFLLFSVLFHLGSSNCKTQSPSEASSWRKLYTFRFIELHKYFYYKIQITPKTEEQTFVTIPSLGIHLECLPFQGQSFNITRKSGTVEILSTADITVHGMVFSTVGLTASFLVLPHDELGTEYLIDCFTPTNNSAQVAISAISNDTTVTVNCANRCTFNESSLNDSVIELQAGESRILRNSENGTEMTGTYIRSNNPISVIVGAFKVYIPTVIRKAHGVILEQLLPISSWGQVHIAPPFKLSSDGWIMRIMAINASTNISIQGCDKDGSHSITLESKNYTDITINGSAMDLLCGVAADRPIQVMQYVASSSNQQYGDPSMTVIPPVIDYHGNTTLHPINNSNQAKIFADVIVAERGKELFHLNGSSISESDWRCFNITSYPTDGSECDIQDEGFCYYSTEVQNALYHMTHGDKSARFWVRLYTLHVSLGAAMLADIGRPVISAPSKAPECAEELMNLKTKFEAQFQGNFSSYEVAEEVLDNFSSYLADKKELGSVHETDIALAYFFEILKRRPLANATGDDARLFLNKTSGAVSFLFSNRTNEHLTRACQKQTTLTSSAEDVQYKLEELLTDASALIVDGGMTSFGVARENAAITISSTNEAMSSGMAATLGECEGALDIAGSDVSIPCEVVREMGSRAVYQMTLPYGGDVIASSKCGAKTKIGSPLLSIGLVSSHPKEKFRKNISISFVMRSLEVDVLENNTLCSFWSYAESNWSTSGCTLGSLKITNGETRVTCLCDHLTSFAVLIDVSPGEVDEMNKKIMKLLTWIGCCFSIAACLLTCFGYAILRLRSDLILVHGNLALAVGLAEIAFLCLGTIPTPSEKPISCIILASFIYYHFMAMFAWMAIEGIHLYLLTFVVWNAEKRKIKWYMACGWGIPVIFTVVLFAVREQKFKFNKYCFLSMADNGLLYFIVPVAVVIVFNIFVTIRVVVQIVRMADGPTMQGDIKTRAKYGVKAMIILLPIMGLTWVVGFLAVNGAKVTFLYIFIVLNCLQGVFIFFIHFFRNSEVRKAFQRQREKWAVSHTWHGESSSSKNTRKSSSSAADKNLENLRVPMQTMTMSNLSSTKPHNM